MQYSKPAIRCQPGAGGGVDEWCRRAIRQLWPSTCVLCGRAGASGCDLCSGCEGDLPVNCSACSRCAEPLPQGAPALCGACLRHPPPFDGSFVPFRYGFPIDHLIRGLKFHRALAAGRVLGEVFAHRLLQRGQMLPQLIIPVPLSPVRFRARGYNQASELALPIRRLTRVPVRADLLRRVRNTAEQTGLDRRQRRRNVRHAFALLRALPASHVAILDDVVTTGCTVREIAGVLRRAGAQRVEVWAIARAGRAATPL